MQTFLPYKDFAESAKCLDGQRLGKQRVEAKQILLTLQKGSHTCLSCGWDSPGYAPDYCNRRGSHVWRATPWYNHPAVKMWRGSRAQLCLYGGAICIEWRTRRYRDTLYKWFRDEYAAAFEVEQGQPEPKWLGNEAFHRSHQSNLIRKLPEHYQSLWPDVPNDLPYVWPV